MKKKFLSLFTALAMLLSLLPTVGLSVSAGDVELPDNLEYVAYGGMMLYSEDGAFTVTVPEADKYEGKLWYNVDEKWQEVVKGEPIEARYGQIVFIGSGNTVITGGVGEEYAWQVVSSGTVFVMGNLGGLLNYATSYEIISSLMDDKTPTASYTVNDYAFASLFQGNADLDFSISIIEDCLLLEIPMSKGCCESLFAGCTGLTTLPEVPAIELAEDCYKNMFYGCTAIDELPIFAATSLKSGCYEGMFAGCTGIRLSETKYSDDYDWWWLGDGVVTAENATTDMLKGTGGSFAGTPAAGTKYYYEPLSMSITNPLTFTSDAPFTVTLPEGEMGKDNCYKGTVWYSVDNKTWAKAQAGEAISSGDNHVLYFAGKGNTVITDGKSWSITAAADHTIAASGNLMTLLDYENPNTATMGTQAFAFMFYGCTALTSAPELPATTLAERCYFNMFNDCTALTSAPELPATKLATRCYYNMFANCSALTLAPELPATTLAEGCYMDMFSSCTKLTVLPELPATVLAENCYNRMFNYCTGIKLTATPTAYGSWSLPAGISTSDMAVNTVFCNTGGDFTGNPESGVTYYYMASGTPSSDVADASYFASLTLGDSVAVNFKMKAAASFDNSKFEVFANGNKVTLNLETANEISCVLKEIDPEKMGDAISVIVKYNGVTVKGFNYSVKKYCDAVISQYNNAEGNDKAALKASYDICNAVLHYGKYAYDYANGGESSTLNEGIAPLSGEASPLYRKASDKDAYPDALGDKVSAVDVGLVLGSRISLKFTVTTTKTGLKESDFTVQTNDTFSASSELVSSENIVFTDKGAGVYEICLCNLTATQAAREYRLSSAALGTFSETYGVLDYCKAVCEGTGEDSLKNLCKALANYAVCASAFAQSIA